MTDKNNHSTNCTTFFPNYQLFLPMDIGVNISKSAPVRVISKLLEGLDYRYLMQAYSKNKGCGHKIEANKMFFIIAYAMFDGVNTTRAVEKNCRENINYMWILREALPLIITQLPDLLTTIKLKLKICSIS